MTKIALAGRFKNFSRTARLQTGVALILLVPAFLHQPAQAADFKGCNDCHKPILEAVFRTNQHVPFLQQRCGECHLPKSLVSSPENNDSGTLVDRRKINWLGESYMTDTSHGFVLPVGKVGDALIVEVQGSEGTFSRQEISVPPLAELAAVTDGGKPPVISEVRVLKVQRQIFLSATIGWQTDTLTNSQVRYGMGNLSQTAQSGNRFGRRHQIILYNLKPDQTYRFSVVSKDLFGRSQASEPFTFSTSKPLETPQPAAGDLPQDGEGVEVASRFRRLGSDYLLELAMEQPVSVLVGSRAVAKKRRLSGGIDGPTGGNDLLHIGLSSKKAASLDACGSCHQQPAAATHPVNVRPKPGMIIPPEYPTLPDGRITCRTCHESHSSDNEYLAVKPGRRELCVGCHRDMM